MNKEVHYFPGEICGIMKKRRKQVASEKSGARNSVFVRTKTAMRSRPSGAASRHFCSTSLRYVNGGYAPLQKKLRIGSFETKNNYFNKLRLITLF